MVTMVRLPLVVDAPSKYTQLLPTHRPIQKHNRMSLLFNYPISVSVPHKSSSRIPNPRPIRTFLVSKSPKYPSHPPLKAALTPLNASASLPAAETVAPITGEEDDDLEGSPWEGAVVYRRDATAAHVEYCTTLERLGLGRLSSRVSRARASVMGIRVPTRRGKGLENGVGTPVLVSVDVTRRRRRLKLDGIVRTVLTLDCNRCAEPAAECVFSNFTLLLTEDPVEEPDKIDIGTIFGDDKSKNFSSSSGEGEDFEEEIDLDDTLHFPAEEKEIDISKHIRDIVHVEITINAICDASCKGLCLKCGTNLNKGKCNCSNERVEGSEYGPLKDLRKQMQ